MRTSTTFVRGESGLPIGFFITSTIRRKASGTGRPTRKFTTLAVALWTLIFAFPTLAYSAGNSGYRITGMVKDALGRPIANAQLVLEAADGHAVARARSNQNGVFEFRNMAKGTYAVVASKGGFMTATSIVTVTSQAVENVDLALQSRSALSLQVVTTKINPQPNGVSKTGTNQYSLTDQNINTLPQGANTPINQVLLQMPGVVQDDEAQVHVDGEHEDLQWRVNGVMMPMDSFTGFGQIFNSFFVKRVSLLDGVLPVTYGYRDAGVLDMVTKDGCSDPGGNVGFYGGQREWLQPSFEYGGCEGAFSYYVTGTYIHNNLAFSSATPGPTPIHNITNQGQSFGYFTYQVSPLTKLSLIYGVSVNDSQYPAAPGLTPLFQLAGVNPATYPSQDIKESLDQDYYFGILALSGVIGPDINYQVAYTGAYSTINFGPDPIGDLIYEGGASRAFHGEFDNTLQTDLSRNFDWRNFGSHNIGAGFYLGYYGVESDDTTLAFPVNSQGLQASNVPITIIDNLNNINLLYGVYLQDIWSINEQLTLTTGVRFDGVSGIIDNNMISPRINLLYTPNKTTAVHAGFARYFQTPDFATIPQTSFAKFQNTTAAVGPGGLQSYPEKDYYWDAGVLHHFGSHLTVTENAYFRLSQDLIDLGQFGFVPIFEPFNYQNGRIWGSEFSATYDWGGLTFRGNFTYSVAQGNQVVSGQFNFAPDEIAYIAKHYIFLDHTQQYTASGGVTYHWRDCLFSLTGTYGSGLRSGFANTDELPENFQIDLAAEKGWQVPNVGNVKTRVVLINATDNINELRNGTGIGIFEPGYGPRRAVYAGITVPLPAIGGSNRTP
jgi:outer membrane receptor protein involved in Fe transport